MWTHWNDLIGAVELTCPDLWYQTILGPGTAVWVSPPGQNILTAVAWRPSPSLCRVSTSRPSLTPAAGGGGCSQSWADRTLSGKNTIILYINTFTIHTLSTFCWFAVWMCLHTVAFLPDLHEISESFCWWLAEISWYCSDVTVTLSSLFPGVCLQSLVPTGSCVWRTWR